MNFLERALHLAEKGFYVFPLQAGGKIPAIDDFTNRATRNPEEIKNFWFEPVLGIIQPYNIGIATSKYKETEALVVIDIDNKGSKKGDDEILKLELQGFEFPETFSQTTPSKGTHLIYKNKISVKQGESVLGLGLDIRSKGGYIVGPGSVIDEKFYEIKDLKNIDQCPAWILEACGKVIEKEKTPKIELDQNRAQQRAVLYLQNEAPLAVEGQGGDQTTFKVAAFLKDFGLEESLALDVMLRFWNERCTPPWDPEELSRKIQNAYSYSLNAEGSRSPEKDFKKIDQIDEENYLEKINETHALVLLEDSYMILHETVDEKGRAKRGFMTEQAFKRKFSPHMVQQGRGPAKTFADIWLTWAGRREYSGLCFRPGQEARNNYYNLWRGFAYEEKSFETAGASARLGFEMFMDHAKNNVCKGDENLFLWLMGYFAHLVQNPCERPLTTLVFRGRKGVGKNVLIDRVGALLGSGHALTAHDSRYLTSNFNGHLDSCLMLTLDEAFWSGDKSAESKLKGLTTAPEIMIERKGKEPYMVDNFVRLVVIGNEDWLVPASYDERRYAVFDVGEGRKQDRAFFSQMSHLMDRKGGAEILLHYLKNFDLSKVEVNEAPNTEGLIDQKLDSMSAFEQFWYQCLIEGRIINCEFFEKWETQVEKTAIRRAFSNYCRERNIRSWTPTETGLGRELKRVTPSIILDQKQLQGDKSVSRVYRIRELDFVRAEWCKRMNIDKVWDN